MNKLQELIQTLCPGGIEYKELQEICHYSKNRINASEVDNTTYVGVENLLQNKQGKTLASSVPTTGNVIRFDIGDILIGNIRPYLKKIWLSDCVGGTNGDVLVVQINDRKIIIPEFLYYVLSSDAFFTYDMLYSKGAKMPRGNKAAVMQYRIPIPPLEVQQEIVHLLDDFTAKTAELQAELNKEYEARKKQYEYYKEVLLYNNENVDKVKIKDIVCKTNKIKWNQTKNTYQYIDLSSVDRETHTLLNTSIIDGNNAPSRAQQIVRIDDVLFGTTRPMLKRICVIPDEYDGQICSTGFCVLRAIDSIVQPKWIYHVLNTAQFYSYVESHQQGTSYPSISDSLVKEYEITLPSLDEQIRIINILDNLEETNFELNNNLSLELESRQKQYEYYRDKLLTFKELNESGVN